MTRRALLGGFGAAGLGAACAAHAGPRIVARIGELMGDDAVTGWTPVRAVAEIAPTGPRTGLVLRAKAALDAHPRARRDRIAVVDFSRPSSQARLHVLDLEGGSSWSSLVCHGSGSDPRRTGWVERLSNEEGSNASCVGSFLVGGEYEGRHGRSARLVGLDPTNDNAMRRAIVVHGAWYAEPDIVRTTGALGRSQGCFAVGDAQLPRLLSSLGEGRLIHAWRA